MEELLEIFDEKFVRDGEFVVPGQEMGYPDDEDGLAAPLPELVKFFIRANFKPR